MFLYDEGSDDDAYHDPWKCFCARQRSLLLQCKFTALVFFFSIMHLGAVNRSINTCVVVDVVRRGASSLTSDRPLDIAGRSLTGELRVLSAGNQVSTSIDRATVVEDTSSSVQNVVCNKPISTTVQMHTERRNCKNPCEL